ncbi:TonB-dependent receptor [Luteimonas sp. RIT-PG2_3]
MHLSKAIAVACLVMSGAMVSNPVHAQERKPITIEAQGLASALERFALERNIEVIYRSEVVGARRTLGVDGEMTSDEALQKLLDGTGLTFRYLGENSVSIVAVGETTSSDDVKSLNTVSVSASRIDLAGFVASTPTAVVSEIELRQGARNNVAAALNDLPAFRHTSSPLTSAGNTGNGASNLNFRGLGASRTLVLLNGRRFVGSADLSSVPFALVKSVDIVTGGASAAWGSDAVAGVVNIVLDDRFEGVKLEARTGLSDRNDGFEYTLSAAAGSSFSDGRGSFIIGGEFVDNEGIFPRTSRERTGRWGQVSNPDYTSTNGQMPFMLTQNVGWSDASLGGLILDGSLAGQAFNPDGSLRPFQYGRPAGGSMVGGEGVSYDDFLALSVPQKRYNLFSRAGYDLSDNVRLSADMRYSRMYNHYRWYPDDSRGRGGTRISIDNAFLPQEVRDRLLASNETGFTLGRANHDFAWLEMEYSRENMQGTVALDGVFGDYWRWDTYVSYGKSVDNQKEHNQRLRWEFQEAADAVFHPVSGQPVCRVALTNPSSACVPINLFGEGNVSQAAKDYVVGNVHIWGRQNLLVGGASLRGEPFELRAGPVSIATGIEARREESHTVVDPRTAAGEFMTWNPQGMYGRYNVKEGFLEALVPLVRGLPLLQELNFNGAVRLSDYSSSGAIWTHKLGITNQITSDLLFRVTKSRDIRSANLYEMYTPGGISFGSIIDPVTGETTNIRIDGGGNPNLVPEVSDTRTVGLVYSPESNQDLSVSLDYFDIQIDNIITSIGAQSMVTRCYDGNAALCSYITRDPVDNTVVRVWSPFVNLARYETSGFDFDVVYGFPLENIVSTLPGKLRLRGLLTYVDELVTDDGVNRVDAVSSLTGVPRIRANLAVTYQNGDFSLDMRARYIHSTNYNRTLRLQNNAIPSYTYVDMGFQYSLPKGDGARFSLFGNVGNVFDKAPPQGAPTYYDLIGRYYNLGARIEF